MAGLIETLQLVFTHLQRNFRIVAILDIGIVALFIYIAMVWFRETTSRLVYLGIAVLGGIYMLSRAFDLYLTSFLFQIAFAVIALLLIIIFQEDIRRVFERIAVWGIYRGRIKTLSSDVSVDSIVETVADLAKSRIGALIVIQGRDPLGRHIQGGIRLGGKISKALLLSLFDPHSPGHDGAVIVDGSNVLQFGAHLPLTMNPANVPDLGTRHSAALGLSERCDALVIVVSQERAEISVAEAGMLKKVSSPSILMTRLERFQRNQILKPTTSNWKKFFRARIGMKVGAITLATLIWIMFSYKTGAVVQRTFSVPLEYRNIAEDLYVVESVPNEIKVTFSGKQAAFSLLDIKILRVSVDLSAFRKGRHEIDLLEGNINYPSNLSLYWLEPKTVKISLVERDISLK